MPPEWCPPHKHVWAVESKTLYREVVYCKRCGQHQWWMTHEDNLPENHTDEKVEPVAPCSVKPKIRSKTECWYP